MRKVYIVNRSGHDFSAALEYGEIEYLSTGIMNKYAIAVMYRKFAIALRDSERDDLIMPTGLTIMSVIACCVFAYKHGQINLLIQKDDRYVKRTIMLSELVKKDGEDSEAK